MDKWLYDHYTRMSYEEKLEMWDREAKRERLMEEKAEWEAERRRDNELTKREEQLAELRREIREEELNERNAEWVTENRYEDEMIKRMEGQG